jgi:secondary thiamine-phosphate synthase enzyme
MQTLESTSIAQHVRFAITTRQPLEFVDLTNRIQVLVTVAGLRMGVVNIQSLHTTTAIVANENEPLLLGDFAAALERAAPGAMPYAHDDMSRRTVNLNGDERVNGHAHCRALFLPSSVGLNVVRGEVQFGQWQRVFLVELDGPRERQVSMMMLGEGRS